MWAFYKEVGTKEGVESLVVPIQASTSACGMHFSRKLLNL